MKRVLFALLTAAAWTIGWLHFAMADGAEAARRIVTYGCGLDCK